MGTASIHEGMRRMRFSSLLERTNVTTGSFYPNFERKVCCG